MNGNKRILFLMAVRNRRERAIRSIESIANSILKDNFECLIVQDFDTDNVSESDFKDIGIPVCVVNHKIGGLFYKTALLNFGIAITTNEIIIQQDADILYCEEFLKALVYLSKNTKGFSKYLFGAPYVESEDMTVPPINTTNQVIRKKGDYIGDTFVFYRPQIEMIRGYDERMRMWHEEEDIANRLIEQFRITHYDMGAIGIKNIHITHENSLRSFDDSERVKNLAIFTDNMQKKRYVLGGQMLGGITSVAFENKKITLRNNEGDMTAYQENVIKDVYEMRNIPLTKESIVVDIGAHVGCFALPIASRVKKVICYEPDRANMLLLRKNLLENNITNVDAVHRAVAGSSTEITLYFHPYLTVLNGPLKNSFFLFSQKVSAISLEEMLRPESTIDLLKVDCEGGEYDIFYSTPREVFKKIKWIVLEYHNTFSEENPEYIGERLITYLVKNGFELVKDTPDYNVTGKTGIAILRRCGCC